MAPRSAPPDAVSAEGHFSAECSPSQFFLVQELLVARSSWNHSPSGWRRTEDSVPSLLLALTPACPYSVLDTTLLRRRSTRDLLHFFHHFLHDFLLHLSWSTAGACPNVPEILGLSSQCAGDL